MDIARSRFPDSTEKILHHLDLLTSREVALGPSLSRKFSCPEGCTACCMVFTLDYLPVEGEWGRLHPDIRERFRARVVRGREVYTLEFPDVCPFLVERRCSLWGNQPLPCMAAPQVQIAPRREKVLVTGKIFSRYWRWPEGNRPQCQFSWEYSPPSHAIRVFERYRIWGEYFGFSVETIDRALKVLRETRSILTSSVGVS